MAHRGGNSAGSRQTWEESDRRWWKSKEGGVEERKYSEGDVKSSTRLRQVVNQVNQESEIRALYLFSDLYFLSPTPAEQRLQPIQKQGGRRSDLYERNTPGYKSGRYQRAL